MRKTANSGARLIRRFSPAQSISTQQVPPLLFTDDLNRDKDNACRSQLEKVLAA